MKVARMETLRADAGWRMFSFLKITTEDGLIGWSEFNESFGSAGLAEVIMALSPIVIGKDPCRWEQIISTLHVMTRQSRGGINHQAIAAIENALLDIAAKARNIPVYTIGAGKDGYVPMPVFDANNRRIGRRMMLSDLDEAALRLIAEETGGKFFRAVDTDTIESAFKAIDRAQKIEFQAKSYLITTELFWWLATPGLAALALAAVIVRPLRSQSVVIAGVSDAEASPPFGQPPQSANSVSPILPKQKPGTWLLVTAILLVLFNLLLGFFTGLRASGNSSYAIGNAVGQLLGVLAVALLFAISPRFRSPLSTTRLVMWSSVAVALGNLARLK